MIEVLCSSVAETMALGRRLASLLHVGDVILLSGDLGSGKTAFASGIAEGLGVEERVTSPSFVIVRTYTGLIPFTHVDVYRLQSSGEFEDLELVEDAADGVLVIEWGPAVVASVPRDHLLVTLDVTLDEQREISLFPKGSWRGRPLRELQL
ncbi:MAG: tRNA (adenosine(37)-N6)-threonylcarbamoyltransferase complex ATPase subunit type 1 TsaE [Acidimicrobiia bacterium]|nr:tRNA (adenosine(37)-N6)-threonylcarbamoyltransferase complex ATPase subunit type 1 TsaE [Acidimicrobiia bacterium]NNL29059.1 tRNA (adenosine(37)-N6)-threonylcarbamoyltransferase complex ATPase subunit type 1 TsaE [Acidimicrobiia bacterium]